MGIRPRGGKERGEKKGNARREKAARFGVLRKEGGNDTNRGGQGTRRQKEGASRECRSREQGDCCIMNRIATRGQQRAAMPSQTEGKLRRTPLRRGCSRKECVDKYGDIYGTNREFRHRVRERKIETSKITHMSVLIILIA